MRWLVSKVGTDMDGQLRRSSFLIRIWRVSACSDSPDGGSWRGQITHVQSNDMRAFDSLNGLIHFLEEKIGPLKCNDKDSSSSHPYS